MKATLMTIWIISLASLGFAQDSIQQKPELSLTENVRAKDLELNLTHDQARRWREILEKYDKEDVKNIEEGHRAMIKELLCALTKNQLEKLKIIIQIKWHLQTE
jgi:hypothetical protein